MQIEKFLETRMRQSEAQAERIRKYIAYPNKFIGKKQYTDRDVIDAHNDFIKCRAALRFLEELQKNSNRSQITIKVGLMINELPDDPVAEPEGELFRQMINQ